MAAVNTSIPSTQALAAQHLAASDDPASTAQAKPAGPGISGPLKGSPPAPPASNRPSQLSPEQLARAATDAGNAFLDERDALPNKLHDIQYSTTIPTQHERDDRENKARAWVEHLKQSAIRTAQDNLDAQLERHPTEVIAKKLAPPADVLPVIYFSEQEHPEVTSARDLLEQALETPLGIGDAAERKVLGKFIQLDRANDQLRAAKQGSPQHTDAQNRVNRIAAELPDDARKNIEAWSAAETTEISTNGNTAKARFCKQRLDAAQGVLDRAEKLAPLQKNTSPKGPSSAPNIAGPSDPIDAETEKLFRELANSFRELAKEAENKRLAAFESFDVARQQRDTIGGKPHSKQQMTDAQREVVAKAEEFRDRADETVDAWARCRPIDGRVDLFVEAGYKSASQVLEIAEDALETAKKELAGSR
jgi:hypothetical protein